MLHIYSNSREHRVCQVHLLRSQRDSFEQKSMAMSRELKFIDDLQGRVLYRLRLL